MSKKWIIFLSVIFSVIAVLLILFWTLFGLSSVSVSFDSTTQNLIVSEEQIVQAGGFKKHASVLFEGKNKYIQKIYAKAREDENFAYIKISNIETVFPNKFVVHITEREELFAVEYQDEYLVCDRELRVLKKLPVFDSMASNAMVLKGLNILNQSVTVGDFLDVEQDGIKKFYSANLQNNKNLGQILGKFKQMQISSYEDEITSKKYDALNLTTFTGRHFLINNIAFALPQKLQLMYAVESALFSGVDENGYILNNNQVVLVEKTEAGELVLSENGQPLKLDMIKNCTIKVDNLTITDYTPRTEKDIYYAILP